jgi:RNA polymerase sigma-70 factor (ECF subfamily)
MTQAAMALARLRHPGAAATLRRALTADSSFRTLTLASTSNAIGYTATGRAELARDELCAEGIRLGRLLYTLMPGEAEVEGLLALMLLHAARRAARTDSDGALVTLEQQDRSLWDRAMISEGTALVETALRRGHAGSYQLQAAISAVHAEAPSPSATDWPQIAGLYALLLKRHPAPIVELNHAVAVGMAAGAAEGLALLDGIAARGELDGYHLLHAARAELMLRVGRVDEAAECFRQAIADCSNGAERRFLEGRLRGAAAGG